MKNTAKIDIRYEDDTILIVNKPPGLLCVPGLSDPENLHQRVLNYNANARVVHRLDMATSGLVIFALSYESQKAVSRLFELRRVQKKYIAVVAGLVKADTGEISSSMLCDWPKRPKQKIDWLNGKHAHTCFKVLTRVDQNRPYTRIQLSPVTGRTHQLRVHMEQIGHPIIGDKLYQHVGVNDFSERLHLHAYALTFQHPLNETEISLICEAEF